MPMLARTLLIFVAALPLGAQQARRDVTPAPVSAPISDVHYDVTFDATSARARTIHVVTTFGVSSGAQPVLLSLPAWTPGAYEISEFARWVSNFSATADGQPLQWDKFDYDTWRVLPASAKRVTVSFDYLADSLDNAMAWARNDFALFNGTNLFLYPEGRGADFAATVAVHTEPSWRIATGMKPGAAARTYTATNYHDLVDMPFFVGRFDIDSTRVSERWVRFATYPAGSVSGGRRAAALEWLGKVIPPEVAVFGEVPWDNYTVMQIADSSYAGASGLEHQSSHVDVVTPLALDNAFMPSLYAHEIFHSWNVKRMRPADLVPYRYDGPQPTPWLWVSEGITDYYADLAEVRGGVIDAAGFYRLTSGKITEVASKPPTALEDASVNTWIHPKDGTEYLYYDKGSLAGLLLDVMIRDASDDKRSLDDVMREVYQTTYKQGGRGFTSADWWGAVSRAAGGKSFDDFNRRYVDGRDPFPYSAVLALAGLRVSGDTARQPQLGVYSAPEADGSIRITAVDSSGAAAAAGIRVNDILVSVGDISIDENFGARFRAKYAAAKEGTLLPIRVRRGAQTLSLNAPLRFVVAGVEYTVTADPAASAKAVRIRNGILKGTRD